MMHPPKMPKPRATALPPILPAAYRDGQHRRPDGTTVYIVAASDLPALVEQVRGALNARRDGKFITDIEYDDAGRIARVVEVRP